MLKKILKVLKWVGIFIVVGFVIIVIVRTVHFFNLDKTNAQVAKIHSTKITLDDVMGKNLPSDPGVNADATVQGIDANNNNIRDDVELAIFKEYPNSAKTRAVLLQYALALQMETTQPIVNKETVIAVTQEGDRANLCVGEILNRDDNNEKVMEAYFKEADKLRSFIEKKQINTEDRKKTEENFLREIGSYKSLDRYCDIDYSTLPN